MSQSKKPRNMSEEAKKKKSAYDTQYILAYQRQRKVLFNVLIPEDVEMMAWLDEKPNKNQYLKNLIKEDMERSGK